MEAPKSSLSLPGLTRQSIIFAWSSMRRMMDPRVKPAGDGDGRRERFVTVLRPEPKVAAPVGMALGAISIYPNRRLGTPPARRPAAAAIDNTGYDKRIKRAQ
jgi:hypothetical protein